MAWQGLVWLCMAWHGLARLVWFGMHVKLKLSSFTTNPGGGVGGWGKSKLKLNPAWAELGNFVLIFFHVSDHLDLFGGVLFLGKISN